MQNSTGHEAKFYQLDIFKMMLNQEVRRSRRYGDSLTLVDLLVEADPSDTDVQQSADALLTDLLIHQLRETDILCRRDHEFLILMIATGTPGARTACERVRKLIPAEQRTENGLLFKMSAYIGMATMPIDHSISSDELAQYASMALQYVHTNHLVGAVAFNEVKL